MDARPLKGKVILRAAYLRKAVAVAGGRKPVKLIPRRIAGLLRRCPACGPVSGSSGAVLFGSAEVQLRRHDLHSLPPVSLVVFPGAGLQFSLHCDLLPLAKVPGQKLRRLPPCHNVEKVRLGLRVLPSGPVHRHADRADAGPALGLLQLRGGAKPPHDHYAVDHVVSSFFVRGRDRFPRDVLQSNNHAAALNQVLQAILQILGDGLASLQLPHPAVGFRKADPAFVDTDQEEPFGLLNLLEGPIGAEPHQGPDLAVFLEGDPLGGHDGGRHADVVVGDLGPGGDLGQQTQSVFPVSALLEPSLEGNGSLIKGELLLGVPAGDIRCVDLIICLAMLPQGLVGMAETGHAQVAGDGDVEGDFHFRGLGADQFDQRVQACEFDCLGQIQLRADLRDIVSRDGKCAVLSVQNGGSCDVQDLFNGFFQHFSYLLFLSNDPKDLCFAGFAAVHGHLAGDLGHHLHEGIFRRCIEHGHHRADGRQCRLDIAFDGDVLPVGVGDELQGDSELALCGGVGVDIHDVLDQAAHLIIRPFLKRAVAHLKDRFSGVFLHFFSPPNNFSRTPGQSPRCSRFALSWPASGPVHRHADRADANSALRLLQLRGGAKLSFLHILQLLRKGVALLLLRRVQDHLSRLRRDGVILCLKISVRHGIHILGDLRLDALVRAQLPHKVRFQRRILQNALQDGLFRHLLKVGLPGPVSVAFAVFFCVLAHIVHAHHIVAKAAVLRPEHRVNMGRLSPVRRGGDVLQRGVQAEGIGKPVVGIDHMGLNGGDLAGAIRQIDHTLVTNPAVSHPAGVDYIFFLSEAVHLERQLTFRPTRLHSSPIVSTLRTRPNTLAPYGLS
nr:MAG TPA: hypothetical protein [Caudoviricetes sp.]